jgi:hypothetical protein
VPGVVVVLVAVAVSTNPFIRLIDGVVAATVMHAVAAMVWPRDARRRT